MKALMVEACKNDAAGSIGAWYVAHHARLAGHEVDFARRTKSGYDVELISVHHCIDFPLLAKMPKRAPVRIVGGHPTANNPRPVIPFADVVCIGEGETWIKHALNRLEKHGTVDALADLPGTIISKDWQMGDDVPVANVERPLPNNPPYLNHPNTRRAAWYVEVARGCPFSCHYCELGHSIPFRKYSVEHIQNVLDQADTSITRKINFYAPDEASHPDYPLLYDELMKRGYSAAFSSMRVDSIIRQNMIPQLKRNHLIRVGIDGMTEETRWRVNKKISDDQIVDYFEALIKRGHIMFKMFFIFGYPWEKLEDFAGFEHLMQRLFAIPLTKNLMVRIKWTPFIPQPCTPLANAKAKYDLNMVDKINVWHALNRSPRVRPGWCMEQDEFPGMRAHRRQCMLTSGDETILLREPGARPLHRIRP